MITIWYKRDQRTDEDVWYAQETEMLDDCKADDRVIRVEIEPTAEMVINMLRGVFGNWVSVAQLNPTVCNDQFKIERITDLAEKKRSWAAVKAHATRGTYGKA